MLKRNIDKTCGFALENINNDDNIDNSFVMQLLVKSRASLLEHYNGESNTNNDIKRYCVKINKRDGLELSFKYK
jgi:hypothetical protein